MQYACGDCRRLLALDGIAASMSREDNCLDNAPMESSFGSLKTELAHRTRFATRAEARRALFEAEAGRALFEHIEIFYNRRRRHSSIGYRTPAQARIDMVTARAAQMKSALARNQRARSRQKINGRKRHAVVDTIGLLFGLVVHAADVQERDGAPAVLTSIRRSCPWLRHVFADGGYAGPKPRGALDRIGEWTIKIIKRSDTAKGFEVLPRRWVVVRTFAWLGRCRGLAKDWEKSIASAEARINVSHIRLTTRRLARYCYV